MARLAALPTSSREMVEVMACLGGRAELGVLAAATAESARRGGAAPRTRPRKGRSGSRDRAPMTRFGSATTASAKPSWPSLSPAAAQRATGAGAAAGGVPELFAVAAEQYLPVVDAVTDAAERSQVVALLRRAAEQATLVGGYSQVHTLLTGALRVADGGDTATLIKLHTGRLTALFCLGRLEEADEDYRIVERLSTTRCSGWTRRACRCAA